MKKSYGEIVRFAIVGTGNFLIIMAVSWALLEYTGLNKFCSNAAAYALALINNFYWNRRWVFRSTDGAVARQAALFLTSYAIAYLVQLAVFALLVRVGLDAKLANFIGLFPFGATNFLLNKFLAFK